MAIVHGVRTPFVKAGGALAGFGPRELGAAAVRGLLERCPIDPALVEAVAFGAVVPQRKAPNVAREIVFATDLPARVEAHTLSAYCITGMHALSSIADSISVGRIDAGVAGGAEVLSGFDPDYLREPTGGLSMGEHMELTVAERGLSRVRQDEIALASHRNATRARGWLAGEIVPVPGADVEHDTGPRATTSLEALAALAPVFAQGGTLTAGNSSPVTDGAAAVLLMSEERARAEGLEPLAFLTAAQFGAVEPARGVLMAPAVVVPALLARTGRALADFDLLEIHEAFGAQMLANALAWEHGWLSAPIGALDWTRVNVNGGTIALGHPWSATGVRLVIALAREMARRDARLGLVSACGAGAQAGAFVLER